MSGDRGREKSWLRVLAGFGLAGVGFVCFASPVAASGSPAALTCTFPTGTTSSYAGGAFTAKPSAALNFSIEKIDLATQSAEFLVAGNDNPGRLAIARAVGANHFLEVVTEGYWNITTVYDQDPDTKLYPAVHSRHFGLVGQPVVAQYAGTCQPLP